MLVGYARVSSTGQNLNSQIEALEKAGCDKIFQEKKSGTQYANREELQNALDFVRSGDHLCLYPYKYLYALLKPHSTRKHFTVLFTIASCIKLTKVYRFSL